MSKRRKFWLTVAACVAGALIVLLVTALVIAQSQWFGNYVKDKVVATLEESTGGRAEIGSFEFNPWSLTVRIRNFVLHGTEPAGADPLARAALLELRLKLFAGLKKTVDLAYVGVSEPKVNFIVNPDGTTNVPAPKVKKAPSQTSGLETVVDLAIGEFRIDSGLLEYSQRASQFSAQGNDLHAQLNFNSFNSSYEGRLQISPLILNAGAGTPLRLNVALPLLLEKDAVSVSGGRITTGASQILLNAGLRDLNSPKITARVNANVSLAEVQRSFALPIDLASRDVPQALTADVSADYNDKNSAVHVQTAHVILGRSRFDAAGTVTAAGTSQPLEFKGDLALDQLGRLAKLGATQLAGTLAINGRVGVDAQKNYAADGTLESKSLSVRSGTTDLRDVSLSSPFHADPYLISLDGLKAGALGGTLNAKIFVQKMEQLSVESRLSGFSIPVLARAFAGKDYGYDGSIGGTILAKSNLKAKGASGLSARTALAIEPGTRGIPVNGRIDATYNGATGVIVLEKSFVALPNSRLDMQGNINQQLNVDLLSHNLADFRPVAGTLPLTLQSGGAARVNAQIKGNVSAPNITAHAAVDRFALNGTLVKNAALDVNASPSSATVTNGEINSAAIHSTFSGSLGLKKWQPLPSSPLVASISIPKGDVAQLAALAGQKDLPVAGEINAEIHINGTYGDPLGSASVTVVNGVAYEQPFNSVQANVSLAHELVTLSNLKLDAAGGELLANGTFHHPSDGFKTGHADFHVKSSGIELANVKPLQARSPGAAGAVNLTADASGDLTPAGNFQIANVTADFSGRSLKVNGQAAGDLIAQARTNNGVVAYNVHSDFAGSSIRVDGTTALAKDYLTHATASIANLPVAKVLAITGQTDIPASGTLTANANVAGTLANPDAQADLTLAKAVVYTEPVDSLTARLHYSKNAIDVPSLSLKAPAGTLNASAHYEPAGALRMHVDSNDIDLSKIKHVAQIEPGVAGGLKLVADVAGEMRTVNGKQQLILADVNADVNAHSLRANDRDLGELHATAKTEQHVVKYNLASNLAQSTLNASGQTQLNGDYITHAKLSFRNIRYANIAPFLPSDNPTKPGFDALVEGEANVDGPAANIDGLTGRLQLDRLMVETTPVNRATGAPGTRKVQLETDGPSIITLDHSLVKVQQLKIQSNKTYLQAGGTFSLKNTKNALGLTLKGEADLGMLQDADRDFYSSGGVALDATVHGSLDKPLLNGRVELKNANVSYADSPNGLSNGNGVILLNGTNATIQNLTGESGGGRIAVTGFAGFTPTSVSFNLRATANRVRTRYSGASVTTNADITLAGNLRRSTLSGSVTIQRIAYSSSSDLGSLLSNASLPPSAPSSPSPLLSNMRLDLRILTAPDLRVVTAYSQKLSLTSNLSMRGTAQDPGVVGSLRITNGELVFFGNTYTVNTGMVNFYNPNAVEPILDLSLETITQGVDVTLGVTGPMNDLKLSYRSDPPLSFEQIVQLLATNTTPSDPTIAAHQPTPPQQSMSQMGESAILGQAVANPLASRVQRVFGLSQFKIDPSFSGSNGQPSARVTLQQKIASNLTFTYITDVTQTNSEIVRVQLDITPKVSAVALRDYNGNVSLEFFYKFQVH